MPFALWHALAWISEQVPGSPLTRNQIALMRRDNLASPDLPGLPELAIEPIAIEAVVPAVDSTHAKAQA
jgi:NADH dehydrogenase